MTDFQAKNAEAARLIFTDFSKAETVLKTLESGLSKDAPLADWADFYQNSARLAAQRYDFEQAATFFKNAIDLFERLGKSSRAADCLIDSAGAEMNLGEAEKADNALERARRILEKTGDVALRARLVGRQGFLALSENNYEKAITQLLDCEQVMSENEREASLADLSFLALVRSSLGEIFQKTGEVEKAAEAYLRVLETCERHGLRSRVSWHYLNAGRAFLSIGEVERAADFFEKAAKTGDDFNSTVRALATANLGFCRALSAEPRAALQLFGEAAELFGEPKNPEDFDNLSSIEGWAAEIFFSNAQPEMAERHLEKALEWGQKGSNAAFLAKMCRRAAHFFEQNEDWKPAFFYQKRANELSELHFEKDKAEKILEIEARHEAGNRRREAEVARLQATGLQLRALRAQMNPHFVSNALNAIQAFLTTGKIAEANDWLVQFSRMMRRALDLSNQETIRLEDEIDFMRKYLEINQKLRFRDRFTFEIEVADEMETDFIRIPTMIVQPYIENAIEHGIKPKQGGRVLLKFEEIDEKTVRAIIEDDGFGVIEMRKRTAAQPSHQKHRSRGREITEERLVLLHRAAGRKIGQWVKTEDLGEKSDGQKTGTRVEVIIPVL